MRHLALASLLALAPAMVLPACGASSAADDRIAHVDAAQLKKDLDAGKVPLLVDVRTPGEYAEGHVPGTVLVPVDEVAGDHPKLAPHKGESVYLICRSGSRSMRAANTLASAGYTVVNVDGGTLGWIDAGYGVEK